MSFLLVFFACLVTTASAQTECGATTYYGPSGVISSPNYPDNYSSNLFCNYDVYSSAGSSFSFIFKSFLTELYVDYVIISCSTNSSFPPQIFSGDVLPDPVSIPSCSQGRVNFLTDYSIEYTGFTLDYFVSVGDCGNTLYSGSHGFVTSPSFPSYYGYNQNCTNIILAPQPSHFHLNFLFIDLPACGLCTCDWVEISCLDNDSSDKQRFCGEVERSFDIYSCTRVLVWFHSDSTNVYPGFNLEYNVTADINDTQTTAITTTQTAAATTIPSADTTTNTASPSPTSVHLTTGYTQTVTQSTHASPASVAPTTPTVPQSTAGTTTAFVPQTTAGTTTAFVPQNCGNTTYYGPSGVISSPNFPGNYSNYQSCNYYVDTSSPSSSIAVIFQAFDTEQCCDYVTISCPTNSFYPSVKYSGSSLPQPLSVPWCSQAAVNFTTDSATVSSGFSLDYYVSLGGCGDTVYTGSHGLVSSPHYPNSYDSNQNCSNIIWSRLRSSFSITFLYMNIEECCDFVELSCIDNAGFGSHRFTGTTIPEKLDIPGCTQVLVWFYADDTIVQTGFNLEYFVAPDSDDHGQRKVPN